MIVEARHMIATRLLSSKICAWAARAAALLWLFTVPSLLRAQEGTVAGTVVAQGNQRPLAGVEVGVAGTPGKGTVTDASGRFRVTGLTGPTVVLNVRFLGFRPLTDTVQVGTTDLRIEMSERVIELNSVVVTGTAGGAQVRELGTSVAVVNAADIQAQTAVPTVQGLITGRAPGVDVISATGQVGAGSQIRVRGVGSFSLSGTPLVYIDGVRTNNGQTGIVSRFNDIAPEEIASIEVLKGPAAATLYGTEAARGVINIITKRGTPGSSAYNFSAQTGNMWFDNAEGRMRTNYWLNPVTNDVWSINMVKSEKARGTPLFRTGDTYNFTASASGGAGIYRHFIGGEFSQAEGIVASNERTQKNARANLSVVPSSKLSIETSAGYLNEQDDHGGRGRLRRSDLGSVRVAAAHGGRVPVPVHAPCRAVADGRAAASSRRRKSTQQTSNWQDVRRFTGSASIKYDPVPWLSNRFLIGTDYTHGGHQLAAALPDGLGHRLFPGLAVRRTAFGDDAADDVQHVRLRRDGEVRGVGRTFRRSPRWAFSITRTSRRRSPRVASTSRRRASRRSRPRA